jgi:hypothetical protein
MVDLAGWVASLDAVVVSTLFENQAGRALRKVGHLMVDG